MLRFFPNVTAVVINSFTRIEVRMRFPRNRLINVVSDDIAVAVGRNTRERTHIRPVDVPKRTTHNYNIQKHFIRMFDESD